MVTQDTFDMGSVFFWWWEVARYVPFVLRVRATLAPCGIDVCGLGL